MHYTPAQTRWFLAAIDAAERDAHRADVIAARMGQADVKVLREYLAALVAPKG